MPHAGGRPPKYKSLEELQAKIAEYWEHINKTGKMPTKGNLSLFLGLTNETLRHYVEGTDENGEKFSSTIKESHEKIEDYWVQNLTKNAAAGTIFYLKNAFKYRDKQETDITSAGQPINIVIPQEIAEKNNEA